jgi:hypothetical protein
MWSQKDAKINKITTIQSRELTTSTGQPRHQRRHCLSSPLEWQDNHPTSSHSINTSGFQIGGTTDYGQWIGRTSSIRVKMTRSGWHLIGFQGLTNRANRLLRRHFKQSKTRTSRNARRSLPSVPRSSHRRRNSSGGGNFNRITSMAISRNISPSQII